MLQASGEHVIHGALKMGMAAVPSQAGCFPAAKGLNATAQPACACCVPAEALGWRRVPASCCSLLRCPGRMHENDQKRGQQQRPASEPATHANHSLALPREIFSPFREKGLLPDPLLWVPDEPHQPQKAWLVHPAILSPGDGVCGLLTEIWLGLPLTKCRLLLCPFAPLPSSVLSAEAVNSPADLSLT